MAYEWDKTRPTGSQPMSDLDNAVRDTRAGVEDFLDDEHTIDVSNPAAVTCKHALGSARAGYDTEANKPTTGPGIETGRLFVASDSKKVFVGNGSGVDEAIPQAARKNEDNTFTGHVIVDASSAAKFLQARMSGAIADQGGLVVDQGSAYRLRITAQETGAASGQAQLRYEAVADKSLGSAALQFLGFTSVLLGTSTLARIASGSYTGDGAASRTITVPFTPRLVIVKSDGLDEKSGYSMAIGLASAYVNGLGVYFGTSAGVKFQQTPAYIPTPTTNGFTVGYSSEATWGTLNASGKNYAWVALG